MSGVACLLVLMLAVTVSSCTGKKGKMPDKSFSEYAAELEANGNIEAAATLSRQIVAGHSGEVIRDAHQNIAPLRATDEFGSLNAISSHFNKGGSEQ